MQTLINMDPVLLVPVALCLYFLITRYTDVVVCAICIAILIGAHAYAGFLLSIPVCVAMCWYFWRLIHR
jgi:hypothetical protein